ncbi:MAG TPA: flavin reductase family protein [Syntrophomonadaceae bacterium]|nr:flavin reductase family protein [Syntrophomonadaceae bacterium]
MMKKEVPLEKAHRLINTGCVLLVTSAYRDRSNIMTLAWQTPLSGRPPRVGIAVALPHFTCELINRSKEFALNIPGAELLEQADRCGRTSGRAVDKFKEVGLTPVTAQKVQAPLIKECLGHLECGVVDHYKIGDHAFFVGEVLAAFAEEELFASSYWHEEAKLLHHLGGKQYYISGQREEAN